MALVGRYETNYPVKLRAWTGGTLQETKIPHVPESMSRPPRWDSHRALISNPAFQRLNHAIGNKSEEDMEPILMQPPRRQGHPHRVTKTEKLNVLRECQWQVSDGDARDEDERACARTPLTRSLIILLTAVCVTSLLSIILTLLLLFGTVGSTSCSCNGSSQGKTVVREARMLRMLLFHSSSNLELHASQFAYQRSLAYVVLVYEQHIFFCGIVIKGASVNWL